MTYSKLWCYRCVGNKIKEEIIEVVGSDGDFLKVLTKLGWGRVRINSLNTYVDRHTAYYTDKKSFQEYRKVVLTEIIDYIEELKSNIKKLECDFDKLTGSVCVEDLDRIMEFDGLNVSLRTFIRVVEKEQNLKEADLNNMTNDELGKYIDKLDRMRGL